MHPSAQAAGQAEGVAEGDRIELRGIRAFGCHGALPEERRRAQPFEVDVDLVVDLAPAGASDDLGDTVDYGTITLAVASVIELESFTLLERLASRLADVCRVDPRVTEVGVSVRKLHPPIATGVDTVGVTIRR